MKILKIFQFCIFKRPWSRRLWRKTSDFFCGSFFCDKLWYQLRKFGNFSFTPVLFSLAYFSTPKSAGAPCMCTNSTKVDSNHHLGLPNVPKKNSRGLLEKCRFFLIALILTPISGENTKMGITPKRLDRFQKYFRFKSLISIPICDRNLVKKFRPP